MDFSFKIKKGPQFGEKIKTIFGGKNLKFSFSVKNYEKNLLKN